MRLAPLLCVFVVGCGPMFSDGPAPIPQPQPTVATADQCLREYGRGLADCFDRAADRFTGNEPAAEIASDMGDEQRDARVKAFMPLMEALSEANPTESASQSERDAADAKRASLLRQWAKELRGVR